MRRLGLSDVLSEICTAVESFGMSNYVSSPNQYQVPKAGMRMGEERSIHELMSSTYFHENSNGNQTPISSSTAVHRNCLWIGG